MAHFRHIHASGRFNQSVPEFAAALVKYRTGTSVVTVTEVDNNARARLLASNGWEGVWGDKGPRDDCGITWDPKVWDEIWSDTVVVSEATYKNERHWETGKTVPAFAVLRHKGNGSVVVFGSLHTPHGMQDELRKHSVHSDVARAYVSITNGYRRYANKLARKHKADGICLSGDWNLNVRMAWASAWLKTYASLGGLKLNWTGKLPVRGTHGKEIIDATLYKGMTLVGIPVVLAPNPGDDHIGYKQIFRI